MQEFNFRPSVLDTSKRIMSRWSIANWVLLYLLIAAALQIYVKYPWDTDTAYHVVVGRLIQEHGILHDFPWTPFSWLSDHYADKELLFHLLFVPLAGFDWITAAKIVGTLAGATILLAIYVVLRAENVSFAGLWALIPLSASVIFIFRFSMVRPHLLSIALAVVFLWAALRGRLIILAIISLIFPWAYVAFWQIPCLLLVAAMAARFLSAESIQWKPSIVVATGIALGVAIHPNAVNLLRLNWVHMVDILFKNSWGGPREAFELGTEFNPFSAIQWAKWLLVCLSMTVASLVIAWRNRLKSTSAIAYTLTALGFCILTIKTQRFSEYFIPFSAVALAINSRSIKWRFLLQTVFGISIIYTLAFSYKIIIDLPKLPDYLPPDISIFLNQRIPPGSQVFTTDWGQTGRLMLALPDRRFMVALDPTLFYLKDSSLYRIWYRLRYEAPSGSAETIRRYFGARYVLGRNIPIWNKFFQELASEPGVRTLLISDTWILMDLGVP